MKILLLKLNSEFEIFITFINLLVKWSSIDETRPWNRVHNLKWAASFVKCPVHVYSDIVLNDGVLSEVISNH